MCEYTSRVRVLLENQFLDFCFVCLEDTKRLLSLMRRPVMVLLLYSRLENNFFVSAMIKDEVNICHITSHFHHGFLSWMNNQN